MILAAGFGKRLGELTKETPKCLIEVGGKTMLEHVIEKLKSAHVTSLVINLHHLSEKVRSYCKSKNNFGLHIDFTLEQEILGTGGGVKIAETYLSENESFYVYNADVYSEIDLLEMARLHKKEKAISTLAVMKRDTSRYLLFGKDETLKGWENPKENKSNLIGTDKNLDRLAFTGIQIVSREIFSYMRDEKTPFSIITSYINAAMASKKVLGFRADNSFWIDVGTPETLKSLRDRLQ